MEFIKNLNPNRLSPVVTLPEFENVDSMIDTGAFVSVWIADEIVLRNTCNAVLKKQQVKIKGFGGVAYGNLYEIPIFRFGELIYPNFPIVTCNQLQNAKYQMILSATAFQGLRYEFDTVKHTLKVSLDDSPNQIVRNLACKVVDDVPIVYCMDEHQGKQPKPMMI